MDIPPGSKIQVHNMNQICAPALICGLPCKHLPGLHIHHALLCNILCNHRKHTGNQVIRINCIINMEIKYILIVAVGKFPHGFL